MAVAGDVAAPPAFVQLASHPLRWRLLTVLAHSDFRVRELVTLIDQPQNLISYHLRLLRERGLVTATRSSFDGRDSYYHLDLDSCANGLTESGAALHPALRWNTATAQLLIDERRSHRPSVLFVCTGNSARSPIAEALLRHHSSGAVTTTSAGGRPQPHLHPHAVRVLREAFDIDISGRRPRHLNSLANRDFDYVITLCDKAREVCPEFGHPRAIHWSIPEPPSAGDADDASYPAFQRTAAEINTRVGHLLAILATTP